MIIVDASIWIGHLREPDPALRQLLGAERVIVHPFILGEIALGSIANRHAVMQQLGLLTSAVVAFHGDVLALIERHSLAGSGVGYVDAHLLASARITPRGQLWTRDRRLHAVATRLDVAWSES